jgi:hypothetical protein
MAPPGVAVPLAGASIALWGMGATDSRLSVLPYATVKFDPHPEPAPR